MAVEFTLNSLADTDQTARSLLEHFKDQRIFLLTGDLGAGKTTIVQAFGRMLKVEDDVVSPTYTIINEYATTTGDPVFHADLYRLKNLQEAIETGI